MKSDYSEIINKPYVIENDGCRLAIFYRNSNDVASPSREIEEINCIYSNQTNNGIKYMDLILTDNILEINQSFSPIFQVGLSESQLRLEIMEDSVTYHYYNNDNGHVHTANTEVLANDCYRYEGYDEELKRDIAHTGRMSDIAKSVKNHLLSEEIQMMVNSVLTHIKNMTNQDLDTVYEFGLLAHFKEQLEELDWKISNSQKKHVR